MTLPISIRLRVHARMSMTRLLGYVPPGAVQRIRAVYVASTGRRRRTLAPVAALLRHRPLAPLTDFEVGGPPDLRFVAVESRLARLLYWYGARGYEADETYWWRRLCQNATSIVEIGANIGYYTVQGASAAPGVPFVAVEANPESADIVRRNLSINGLDHVQVITGAVTDDDTVSTVQLALPDQERYVAPTGAYIATGTEGVVGRTASRTITVPAISAATLLEGADLIKLDIEGYEARVLAAAHADLRRNRPTIVVEVLQQVPQLRRLLREIVADRYLAFAIGDRSLHLLAQAELESNEPLPRYGSRDVILVPLERVDLL